MAGDSEGRTRVIIEGVTPRDRWRPVPDQAHRRRHRGRRGRCVHRRPRRHLVRAAVPQGGRRRVDRSRPWSRWSMTAGAASFRSQELGRYVYTVQGWVDHFKTWSRDLAKRVEAGQDVTVDLLIGAEMVAEAGKHAPPATRPAGCAIYADIVRAGGTGRHRRALSPELARLMASPRRAALCHHLRAGARRRGGSRAARFGAWYELFPALDVARDPGSTAPSRTWRPGCLTWPRWASTCSTCRRSTRSAAASARGRNNTDHGRPG